MSPEPTALEALQAEADRLVAVAELAVTQADKWHAAHDALWRYHEAVARAVGHAAGGVIGGAAQGEWEDYIASVRAIGRAAAS